MKLVHNLDEPDDDTDLNALVARVDADHEADKHLSSVSGQETREHHPNQAWH